jgi:hypothetical protein
VRYVLLQIVVLTAIVGLMLALGLPISVARWGAPGAASAWAAGAICLFAALVAAIPLTVVGLRWPQHLGNAALAGTTIRLVLTMTLGGLYQLLADVHLVSFLVWMLALYLALLAAETIMCVVLVRRTCYGSPAGRR